MTQSIYKTANKICKCTALVVVIGLTTSTLAGCGSAQNLGLSLSSITGSDNGSSQQQNQSQTVLASQKQSAPISFAPVFGPPVKVAQKLSGALKTKAQENKIVVKDQAAKSGYTVRGYLSASPDKQGTKLSYIWDVTNSDGKRAHRIKGEELVRGKQNSNDPWAAVDQSAIDQIAQKTAVRLATWLPQNGNNRNLVRQASLNSGNSVSRAAGIVALVPRIQGAPGDGPTSLSAALRKKLSSKGLKIASSGSSGQFQVQGLVSMSPAASGQENIKLEWKVTNPQGRVLGTVTQQNTIPKGSLNGQWGVTADYVAEAASDGIIKLIKPKS